MKATRFTLIAGALALSACGGSGGNAGQAGGQSTRPPDATMQTPEGKAELRYNDAVTMPAGLPVYPGATPVGSVAITGAGDRGSGQVVSLQTRDSAQQVLEFYAGAAERAGLRVAQRAAYGANSSLTLVTPGGEGVHIQTIGAGDGGTVIQVIAGRDRP